MAVQKGLHKMASQTARLAKWCGLSVAIVVPIVLGACSQAIETTTTKNAAKNPLPQATQDLLIKKGMRVGAPIFIRIYKKESELEVWKQKDDGLFYHFKSYPICNWSGKLGPKIKQGDKQAPEGFYRVSRGQMNPNSKFHLSFNLGYPNAYDRSYKRTGANLMVHGDCASIGCYAMGDRDHFWSPMGNRPIEEIWALMAAAFAALILSVGLWFTGSKEVGLFVGLWVPAIHSLGTLVLTGENLDGGGRR